MRLDRIVRGVLWGGLLLVLLALIWILWVDHG